jgi:hypothetical protein
VPWIWGLAGPGFSSAHGLCLPQCSTTCGLGAVWRLVRCSSGRDEDCALEGRPQPARRCHLQPCAAWHMGNWSKVCEGGVWVLLPAGRGELHVPLHLTVFPR